MPVHKWAKSKQEETQAHKDDMANFRGKHFCGLEYSF